MINDLIKKLRKAANSLEELLDSVPSGNPEIANLIGESLTKKRKYKKYKHWTQTAKGRKIVSAKMKAAWKLKNKGA